MKPSSTATREAAEMLAVQALGFIAAEPDWLGPFLNATGLDPSAIRDAAGEPGFLAGVLDHVLADESLLMAFADNASIDPASIARARRALGKVWERDLP